MQNQDYQTFIKSVLNDASAIAMEAFGKVTSIEKDNNPNYLLTETDLKIGQFIIAKTQAIYPSFNNIDEEAGVIDNGSNFTWVVDPIDGTSNFANGVETFGIMIGLLDGDVPVAGGIALPAFSQIYVAQKGQGAYCNGAKLHVTAEINLLKTLVAYQIDGHQEQPELTFEEGSALTNLILKIRNLRTSNSVFDAAMVARGSYGGFLNKTSQIWDNVAQQVVIEEAGGVYTDYYGKPIDYSNPLSKANDNFTYCGGAEKLHRQIQKALLGD